MEINYKRNIFRKDYDPYNRFYIHTRIGKYLISTVDLGCDVSFIKGKPLYYETMIFVNDEFSDNLDYQERYKTKKQAILGHKLAIQYVLNLIDKE